MHHGIELDTERRLRISRGARLSIPATPEDGVSVEHSGLGVRIEQAPGPGAPGAGVTWTDVTGSSVLAQGNVSQAAELAGKK